MRNFDLFTKLIFIASFLCFTTLVSTAQSRKISMQGFLKDANGKAVVDGNKVLTFKIYDAQTGGTALWTNVFSTVPVVGGVYAVQLGTGTNPNSIVTEISALPWNVPYYVGITVESETELTPRTEFTYAPYTFAVNKSNRADTATIALTAISVGGGVNLAINNSDADIRTIKNSTSPIDKNIYVGKGSGTLSSLYLYSNNNTTMGIVGGNVGIGTSTPTTAKLVINGGGAEAQGLDLSSWNAIANIRMIQNTNSSHDKDLYLGYGSGTTSSLHLYSNNSETITVKNNRVGINWSTPEASLDIVKIPNVSSAAFRGTNNISYFNHGPNEDNYIRAGKTGGKIYINDNISGDVIIGGNPNFTNNVGIGIVTPLASLHVGTQNGTFGGLYRRWFGWSTNNLVVDNLVSYDISVRAEGSFLSVGGSYNAVSDKRIKNILGITNTATDLAILNKIEVTDYKYKDEVSNGSGLQKKVIAQQLQEVYPRAIVTNQGIIPNVFAVAKETKVLSQSTIIITTKAHEFATDDKVKLILEKTGNKELVVTVIDANTFSVAEAINDKVFVYGKHVNDLLTVDYDAVSMLNVSATQELSKQIEQLKAENAKLQNRLMKIEASLQNGVNAGTGK